MGGAVRLLLRLTFRKNFEVVTHWAAPGADFFHLFPFLSWKSTHAVMLLIFFSFLWGGLQNRALQNYSFCSLPWNGFNLNPNGCPFLFFSGWTRHFPRPGADGKFSSGCFCCFFVKYYIFPLLTAWFLICHCCPLWDSACESLWRVTASVTLKDGIKFRLSKLFL